MKTLLCLLGFFFSFGVLADAQPSVVNGQVTDITEDHMMVSTSDGLYKVVADPDMLDELEPGMNVEVTGEHHMQASEVRIDHKNRKNPLGE